MIARWLIAVAVLSGSAPARADTTVAFVSCPIYRDTDAGAKSGCWLADSHEAGQRFDVSLAPTKPDWNFAVLVEGRPAVQQVDACGGVVLDPVRVSVLQDQPCSRAMIPAEGYPGHRYHLPPRNMRPLYEKRKPFETPYTTRSFFIPFDFEHSFLVYQLADYYIDQAVAYALASDARQVNIVGWAATGATVVSGQHLRESPQVARRRAELVAAWMRGLGVPADRLHVSWRSGSKPAAIPGADGLEAPSARRADIEIVPGRTGP